MPISFTDFLKQELPNLPEGFEKHFSPFLFSGKNICLPKQMKSLFADAVSSIYSYSQPQYRNHFGICNSFDFHIDADGQPKLIEINTNAAFLALGYYMNLHQNKPLPIDQFPLETWLNDCLEELKLCGFKEPISMAIVDTDPQNQKLYLEFLAYQAFVNKKEFTCVIADPKDIQVINNQVFVQEKAINFIYNRLTDFYLEAAEHKVLKLVNDQNLACISPYPNEYSQVADKRNLIKWSIENPTNKALLKTLPLTTETAEDIWSQKKKFFIKPQSSYGSKQSYRGESISRKNFDSLVNQGVIAQEHCPASEHEFSQNNQNIIFKADFRVYTYRSKIEHIVARLYQGQVTNSRTEGGGFATVEFV